MPVRVQGFALALELIRAAHRIPAARAGFLRRELRFAAVRLGAAVIAGGRIIPRQHLLRHLERLEIRLLLAAQLGHLDRAALRGLLRSISDLRHLLTDDNNRRGRDEPGIRMA